MEIDDDFKDITEKDYEDYERKEDILMNLENFILYFVGYLFGKNEEKVTAFFNKIFNRKTKED